MILTTDENVPLSAHTRLPSISGRPTKLGLKRAKEVLEFLATYAHFNPRPFGLVTIHQRPKWRVAGCAGLQHGRIGYTLVSYITNSSESENMRTAQPTSDHAANETATKAGVWSGFRETSLADIAPRRARVR